MRAGYARCRPVAQPDPGPVRLAHPRPSAHHSPATSWTAHSCGRSTRPRIAAGDAEVLRRLMAVSRGHTWGHTVEMSICGLPDKLLRGVACRAPGARENPSHCAPVHSYNSNRFPSGCCPPSPRNALANLRQPSLNSPRVLTARAFQQTSGVNSWIVVS